MADSFDPYHRWLGIPPQHQPANHYRLLGIELFESDLDVIRSAADRQMAHVRSHAMGAHIELTQRILNELGRAAADLQSADKKKAYDEKLRTAQPSVAIPPPQKSVSNPEHATAPPMKAPAPADNLLPNPLTVDTRPRPRPRTAYMALAAKNKSRQPQILIGFLMSAVGVIGFVAWTMTVPTPPPLRLQPIRPISVSTGQNVQFWATVDGSEQWDGQLEFQLGSTAPPDSRIDSRSGQFYWKTKQSGLYQFIVHAESKRREQERDQVTVQIRVSAPTESITGGNGSATPPGDPKPTAQDPKPTAQETAGNSPTAVTSALPQLAFIQDIFHLEMTELRFRAGWQTRPAVGEQWVFSLGADAPTQAKIDPQTGEFNWTPTEEQGPGNYTITILVQNRDRVERAAERRFHVDVQEVNRSPIVQPVDVQTVTPGQKFRLAIPATDPDLPKQELTYELASGPAGATVDRQTGSFQWTGGPFPTGDTSNAIVRVSDSQGAQTLLTFSLRVPHRAPKFSLIWIKPAKVPRWRFQHSLSEQQLKNADVARQREGFRLSGITGYGDESGAARFVGIWILDGLNVISAVNVDGAAGQAFFDNRPAGYEPVSNDVFMLGSAARFNYILAKTGSTRGWQSRQYTARSDFEAGIQDYGQQGMRPFSLSVADDSGGASVFRLHMIQDGQQARFQLDLSSDHLRKALSNPTAGWRPIWIDGYYQNQDSRYLIVWQADTSQTLWSVSPQVAGEDLEAEIKKFAGRGYMPLMVSAE